MAELRLPHAMVGFADPSSLLGPVVGEEGAIGTTPVDRIRLTVVLDDEVVETDYGWDPWNRADVARAA
ncbi:MAG: hypothetical protein M5U09_03685 [Gammaproteobacteria bacterium]|nr:hypothetical protein [Gammaproteobacteria bacterium]